MAPWDDEFPTQPQTQRRQTPAAAPKRLKPRDLVTRAAVVSLLQQRGEPPEQTIERLYGHLCPATLAYVHLKAATNPAMTGVPGWAQELAASANADFLTG